MNQHLKAIEDIIQQNKSLSEADKKALIKSIADADKQWSITDFKLDRTEKVKKTTAILLEETIEELEQKRKAVEAQNRELEIEGSLEKVRSSALGMKEPFGMLDVCRIISEQLELLNVKEIRNVQTAIFYEERGTYMNYEYYAKHKKTFVTDVSYTNHEIPKAFASQMLKGKGEIYITSIEGEKKVKEWIAYQKGTNVFIDTFLETATSLNYYWFSLGPVALGISTYIALNDNELGLFKRFLNVFELAYRRYLDIERAEAQAREAQIELGLERVRAKAMAMQNSNELKELIGTVFTELTKLDLALTRCVIWLFEPATSAARWWMANSEEPSNPMSFYIKYHAHPAYLTYVQEWKNQNIKFVYDLNGTDKEAWDDILFNETELKELPDFVKDGMRAPERVLLSGSFSNFGGLNVASLEPLSDDHFDILIRFAKVFEQTYTRFLDLQKAEAQTREAQIQLALERVRAKAMAMHNSEEILNVITEVKEQLIQLGFQIDIANFNTNYKSRDWDLWMSSYDDEKPFRFVIPWFDHPIFNDINDAISRGDDFIAGVLSREEKDSFVRHIFENTILRQAPDESKQYRLSQKGFNYSVAFSKHTSLTVTNYDGVPYSDEQNAVIRRLGKAFDQAYTRFLDLQKAEVQAMESQIETSLERVRSRTLAMQKSDELAETAAVVFRQLITLGIAPNRLYIAIIKDESGKTEFWITDEDGSKITSSYESNLNDNASFKKMLQGWKEEKKSLIIDMQGEELQEYFKYLNSINVPFKGGLTQKRRVQDVAYFGKGFIGIASPDEQPPETIALLERFAAVFNLTYTRFNDLKIAEAHAIQAEEDLQKLHAEKKRTEDALAELQATQKQLIQSEKMASLGELTAGIAHEIQNPLNFVNNFSEVSNELMDEMLEEVAKGNYEEVKAIADDVKQNLEKINHHGKRADGIVKGMLQHSRTSSGQKEATDINQLADEYLRLAFHGLRAKDKTFNSAMKTDYDESIGLIKIIPQDIGRVVINLITNAFYAVNEKKKQQKSSYEPVVSVSTKKEKDIITVTVKDNGNGIPQKVLDKIFQPFFTTKPTGQGTGLGLSLSYDIVKAHGGEIRVSNNETGGASFLIILPVNNA